MATAIVPAKLPGSLVQSDQQIPLPAAGGASANGSHVHLLRGVSLEPVGSRLA